MSCEEHFASILGHIEKPQQSTAGGTLYWPSSLTDTVLETDLAGTRKYEYMFFNGERIARRDGSNPPFYYFSDHLKSTDVVTNNSGAIQDESDYFPYGGEIVLSNLTPQNYKFNGKERDSESGLDEFGARYHSSGLSRFMTPDWAARPTAVPYAVFGDPQSLNLYNYVRNDPVSRADADGHCSPGKDRSCPKLSNQDTAAVKARVEASNKSTSDDKKGKNHEEAVVTGKDANGNHAIVPAKPGAYSDVTKKGGTAAVNPSVAADPSKQSTITTPEVVAHVHPAGTATTLSVNNDGRRFKPHTSGSKSLRPGLARISVRLFLRPE